MRGCAGLLALLAIYSIDSSECLAVKRAGRAGPVAVELAGERVESPSGAASRFVELSHAVGQREKDTDAECPEEGCEFTQENSEELKSLKKKLKKEEKELKKEVKKEKKIYLENHTEEEYDVLKQQAVLEALRRENSGEDQEQQQ